MADPSQNIMPGAVILQEFTAPFQCADVEQVDLRALREAYAEMMDAAAHAVRCHGLEPDDCILEHWADIRTANAQSVRIEWLADRARCVASIRRQCAGDVETRQVGITALRLRVIHEPRFDPFLGAQPGGGLPAP
ncbi:MAG: hypothetical protein GY842_21025 [bacterium]|nr:hypothetical protein [bacterium]